MAKQVTMTETVDAATADSPAHRTLKRATRAQPSKRQQLIRLLSAKAGADVAMIDRKLGWQPHTVRAALSGLRKAGYKVEAARPGEGRAVRYRILAAASSDAESASAIAAGRA
ncbi:DUF3489 domain-containing protein [Defluviimonas sp. WL0075]|uniref:DUF3489 domain-containing protein n=1 Tax=Albidovulum sediminicola TaxID=2984331 RepID=A0ABT2YXC7_9RHOB|nr:DUF3489 domain-containing protein [Defluviimonas sp. WL0075]MCV2863524.1 DUF3489 domain-containing protein [Defluviimonas sp. WL0075]